MARGRQVLLGLQGRGHLLLVTHEGRQLTRSGLGVLLEVLDPAVVRLHRVPHDGVLEVGGLLVELDAAHAVQPLEVHVAFPTDTDSVEDEWRADMNLEFKEIILFFLEI